MFASAPLPRRHAVFWASLGLIGLIAAATGWDIFSGYRAHRAVVERQMATLADIAALQTESSVRAIDLLLEDAAKSIDLDHWPDREKLGWLKARIAAFPEIRNLIVIDANGRMIGPDLSTFEVPAKAQDLSDREYFAHQRDHWHEGALYIAAPVVSRVHGEPILPMARPLRARNGAFAGVVMIGLDPAYFETVLRNSAVAETSSAALLRLDGTVLARHPAGAVVDFPHAPSGVAQVASLQDGHERLIGFRAVTHYPLVATASMPLPVAFQEWRQRVVHGAATVLVLAGAVLLLAFLLERREAARLRLATTLEAHRQSLESRVAERTNALEEILAGRKRTQELLEARLRLAQMLPTHTLHDLLVATLDEACQLTGSEIGFYHFVMADQSSLMLQAWSSRTTREFCQASAGPGHYEIKLAGVWADCVRQRRSVIYNDYPALTHGKGLPEGHAPVRRLMSVPIFRDGLITAVIGVGNKATDFAPDDLMVVETLADMAWDLAEHKRSMEDLAERTNLVQRRYEALRALNDIAALPPGNTNQQLTAALALGGEHLGLPLGIVAKVEGDAYILLNHHSPPDSGLADGQVFVLGDTYCAITLQTGDVVAIPHMAQSAHASHPCYKAFGLESYIAAPVMVGGTSFGTVNFSSLQPYPRDFDDGDLEFMRLLARWVGVVLERELAEAQLVAAKVAAEERSQELASSNSDLEQFAYVASHDLRQPLRMVNSYLALIERRLADKLDDDGREFIGYARDGALQMDRLILDLLEYSRVGRHGQLPGPVDLADMAAEACRNLMVLINETACVLDMDTAPAMVTGNRTELMRLFQNLISNAIKYRAADRPPHVEVHWRRQGDDWVVAVKDNGIGIAPEFHQDVFKIFRRLHTSKDYEGTGIGLAVSQKIVKNHGGRIWIESEPGAGSTFFFTIPSQPKIEITSPERPQPQIRMPDDI